MNRENGLILVILFCLCFISNLSAFADDEIIKGEPYKHGIKKGDLLYIDVMGHLDLSMEIVVDNNGKIIFPLIKEIDAEGKTTGELANTIEEKLSEFVKYPQVTVRYHNNFFVYGEVNSPGEYELRGHINVLKAITIAGGFTDFASHKVKIIKGSEKRRHVWVNIDDIIKGRGKSSDTLVEPGDIIIIPESIF